MKQLGKLTDRKNVFLLAMLSCFLWGSATPVIKIGYQLFDIDGTDTASIILFAGTRFFLAGVLVILFQSVMRRRFLKAPKRGHARSICPITGPNCRAIPVFLYRPCPYQRGSRYHYFRHRRFYFHFNGQPAVPL